MQISVSLKQALLSVYFPMTIIALEKLCMMKGTELEKKATYFHYFMSKLLGNDYDLFLVNKILLNYFLQRAHCAICTDRIWGLGRQGYKCINCKLLVHKKCHKLVTIECGRHSLPPVRHCCLIFLYRAFLITLLEQKAKIGGC